MPKVAARQRGDTIIEVLFAVTVFSLVAVGALAIMNQGTALSRRALETTLVRQQVDAQAETLRFMHDAYVVAYQSNGSYDSSTPAGQWATMVDNITKSNVRTASEFSNGAQCATPPTGSFIVNPVSARFLTPQQTPYEQAVTYAQLVYDTAGTTLTAARGLWIEAVRSLQSSDSAQRNAGFIDFHIRACWYGPGQLQPMRIGTIVRLYEPRG